MLHSRISPVLLIDNGELYKTIPIEIEITNAVNSDLSENNPDYIADNNIPNSISLPSFSIP